MIKPTVMQKTVIVKNYKIKHFLFSLFILCITGRSVVYGQTWDTVGDPCFSSNYISENTLAIDKDGTPYLAFNDTGSITVMKFDGSEWITVGQPAFAPGEAYFITMALDTAGTPS